MTFTEDSELIFDFLYSQGYDVETITNIEKLPNGSVKVNINLTEFRRQEGIEIDIFDLISFVYSRPKKL
jgi:hypothetical protein